MTNDETTAMHYKNSISRGNKNHAEEKSISAATKTADDMLFRFVKFN
jgi:hypothetical protein